jgi:hypothetical protein
MTEIIKYLIIIIGFVSVYIIKIVNPSYGDDNTIEEVAEQVIKYETGVDIDISPMSPEDK